MKKKFVNVCIFLLLANVGIAQSTIGKIDISKIAVPKPFYEPEYTYDVMVDSSSWEKQSSGLKVAFGSTDELYLRSEVPSIEESSDEWEDSGWRGERLNAQVLLWSTDTVEQIRFTTTNLYSEDGKVINNDNINLNLVRYVISDFPYGAITKNCSAGSPHSAWLMPDRFEALDRFDLPGKTVRPVWISFEIPRTSEPGNYYGTININAKNVKTSLKIHITVQKQVLPESKDWNFRLDLWQNPWVVAKYYNLKPWSLEHKMLLKKHLRLYADAGGKYITTYAVHSPWSDRSYTTEGTMIEWLKKVNGEWEFDYSIFDQYVELAMEVGIDKAITIYTPIPWRHRIRYLDEASGNYKYEVWHPDSEQFKTFWNIFLDDLRNHLTLKGWFEKTYLGINENPIEITIGVAKFIKENSKDWRITYAGKWYPKISLLLDDYSIELRNEPISKEIKQRSDKNLSTTYYVACQPARPNNFVFSHPIEGRYQGWYALAQGYDGFLRWAYDAWPADPNRDARFVFWPAGDCFLVYPGGNSCIRFEKLREGIVDFEKVHILKELSSKSENENVKKLMNDLNIHLSTFVMDPDYKKRDYNILEMTDAVRKGKKMIERLSNALK